MKTKPLTTGQRIRAAREAAGLSGTELAGLAKMPQSNISAIECGRRDPETATIRKIAAALGIAAGDLI